MTPGNILRRITVPGFLLTMLGCGIVFWIALIQSCPGLFEDCPHDYSLDHCLGTSLVHDFISYDQFTCQKTVTSTSEQNTQACPEKSLAPPPMPRRPGGPNPGPCPYRHSRAMGQSPLDLKPILLDLPFRPVSTPSRTGSGMPACDPSANANVYIADPFSAIVSRYYTCAQKTAATIAVAGMPLEVEITPDAKLALVTNLANAVTVIDSASNKIAATISLPAGVQTAGIAITPDGARAYVTSFSDSSQTTPAVQVIDIASGNLAASIPVTTFGLSVAITPDGSLAYAAFPTQNVIYVIDTLTNTVTGTLQVTQPYAVAFNPTGTLAYITSGTTPGTVKVLDVTTNSIVNSYAVGDQPIDVVVDPTNGGRWVVVLNYGSGSTSEIDTLTGKVNTQPIGQTPHGLAWTR